MGKDKTFITIKDLDPALFDANRIIRKPFPPNPSQELLAAVLGYAQQYLDWLADDYHKAYPFEDVDYPTRETLAEHIEYIKKEAEAALQKIVEIASINLLNTHNEVLKLLGDPPPNWPIPKKKKEPTTH